MLALATIFLTTLFSAVAQQPPETPGGPPPQQQATGPMPAQPPLNSGYCLDSLRQVPKVIVAPVATGAQIVRIDLILSTASLTPNEVIGFLYTTEDGSTWLGQRTADYQSAADATAINRVLAATHVPGYNVTGFPPRDVYGVPTKHPQLFRVQIPPNAYDPLRINLEPCVVWPAGRPLPDPSL
jgi:hypothetical protein